MLAAITPGFLTGGSAAKTYADFQAHITARATDGDRGWSSAVTGAYAFFTTTAAPAPGAMYGTSWGGFGGEFLGGSCAFCRVVQHGLPTEAVFNEQVAKGQKIFIQVQGVGTATYFYSVTRNGYTSVEYDIPGGDTRMGVMELLYWDDTLKQAFKMNPYAGTGPTPYPIP